MYSEARKLHVIEEVLTKYSDMKKELMLLAFFTCILFSGCKKKKDDVTYKSPGQDPVLSKITFDYLQQ